MLTTYFYKNAFYKNALHRQWLYFLFEFDRDQHRDKYNGLFQKNDENYRVFSSQPI